MARKPRQISNLQIYHVMLRGINGSRLFFDDIDCEKFKELLKHMVEPSDVDNNHLEPCFYLHAYCLMPNHVHLLLRENSESLSNSMQRLAASYAIYFNKRYERIGPLYQDRFRSEPVNDASYFITLIRYLHLNPVEAGMTDSPKQYKWSSWHEYSSNGMAPYDLCSRSIPFRGLSWPELCNQVDNAALEARLQAKLSNRRRNDEQLKELVQRMLPAGMAVDDVMNLPRPDRNAFICAALDAV